MEISPLQAARKAYSPKLPAALRNGASVNVIKGNPLPAFADTEKIAALFPTTSNMPDLTFCVTNKSPRAATKRS